MFLGFFSPNASVFPCKKHTTIALNSSIYIPPTLINIFLHVLQFSPVSIFPPMLHTHSTNYHQCTIIFFSQNFSFICHYHSTIAPHSFNHVPHILYNIFLARLQFSLVRNIPPLFPTHPSTYRSHSKIFFPCSSNFPYQYFSTFAPHPFDHLPPMLNSIFLPGLQISPLSIIEPLLHIHLTYYQPYCIVFFSFRALLYHCQ